MNKKTKPRYLKSKDIGTIGRALALLNILRESEPDLGDIIDEVDIGLTRILLEYSGR